MGNIWNSYLALPIFFIVVIGLIAFCIYFLPSFIAFGRAKKQLLAIFVINLLLGYTVLGWVGALVWALIREESDGS